MMGLGYCGAAVGLASVQQEMLTRQKMRAGLTPEQFEKWQADRTAERRHQELCRAIRDAGENARPRGLGVFW